MTDQKKPLHADTEALTDAMIKAKAMTFDSKAASAVATQSLFEDNLPSTLTMEHVKDLSNYNSVFIAATANVFGRGAIDVMKTNKKVDQMSIEIPMGVKDKVTHTIDRVKEIANSFGNGEPVTKYGSMKTTYEVRAGKNGGQLKAVRSLINDLAAEALSK